MPVEDAGAGVAQHAQAPERLAHARFVVDDRRQMQVFEGAPQVTRVAGEHNVHTQGAECPDTPEPGGFEASSRWLSAATPPAMTMRL
jgi:hypothetical protein